MKKAVVGVTFLLMAGAVMAQEAGKVGAGILLGRPIGPTVEFWLNSNRSLNVGLGFGSDLTAYLDYEWHSWTVLPQPDSGKLNGYVGLGGRLENEDEPAPNDDLDFGIRTMAGMGYFFPENPIELFAEIGPVFEVTDDHGVHVDGGIGVRFYFGG